MQEQRQVFTAPEGQTVSVLIPSKNRYKAKQIPGRTGRVIQRSDGSLYEVWSDGSLRRMKQRIAG